jgi:hypothetical protein
MKSLRYLQLVDLVLWVLAAGGAIIVGSLLLGFVIGRDLLTGKYILFGVGFLLFGIGSLMIQPTRPQERAQMGRTDGRGPSRSSGPKGAGGPPGAGEPQPGEADRGGGDSRIDPEVDLSTLRKRVQSQRTHQHRYEARLQEIGPLADAELPFERRISRGTKVFLTGLVVLGFSLAMEIVGVQI